MYTKRLMTSTEGAAQVVIEGSRLRQRECHTEECMWLMGYWSVAMLLGGTMVVSLVLSLRALMGLYLRIAAGVFGRRDRAVRRSCATGRAPASPARPVTATASTSDSRSPSAGSSPSCSPTASRRTAARPRSRRGPPSGWTSSRSSGAGAHRRPASTSPRPVVRRGMSPPAPPLCSAADPRAAYSFGSRRALQARDAWPDGAGASPARSRATTCGRCV